MAKKFKEKLKESIGLALRYSGLFALMRKFVCAERVTVVVYHRPEPVNLKRHMEFLSRYYNFISLERMVKAIKNKDFTKIPPRSLVVTLDDGYKDIYYLLNIFKKYNITPTVYLCSDIVNTNRRFWFDSGIKDVDALKWKGHKERLEVLNVVLDYEPQKEYGNRQALDFEELKLMQPFFDFQSHSQFHPILTTCDDQNSKNEIEGSKVHLQKLLNKTINHFSYPSGRYSQREIGYLKNCGYVSARTCDSGFNSEKTDPYRLKAMMIADNASLNILVGQICGLIGYIRYLFQGCTRGEHPQ